MLKRMIIVLAIAASLMGVGAAAPASAAPPATVTVQAGAALDPICIVVPTPYFMIADYYHCDGPFWQVPQSGITHLVNNGCQPMSGLSGPGGPADSGTWNNSMSSGINNTAYRVVFYDGTACTGYLFTMEKYTYRETLTAGVTNNLAGSFKVFNP